MMARLFPDPAPGLLENEQDAIFRHVNNNIPGLLEELQPNVRQKVLFNAQRSQMPRGAAGVLNVGGPILNDAMMRFGAKLGMALFYHDLGKILPPDGAVFVRWYSNYDAFTDGLPTEVLSLMGQPSSLEQGRWTVANQFQFGRVIPLERTMAAHMVTFRQSFGILTFAAEHHWHMDRAPQDHVFRPGCLRTGTH
ncbi:hypothetical protein [Dongia deserti]|uniref:hypothetical protein n=1 Tax=Dongia deserti TaxID=2268030 RepID=UPI0013C4B17B|nr:hypothetical protein [Dongia deserti]